MRIVNKKKFTFSCIFFILVFMLISKFDTSFTLEKKGITFLSNTVFAYNKGFDKKVQAVNKDAKKEKATIVLDPGHGGEDKGTSYGDIYEKNINYKIVMYIKGELESKGYSVVLTRNNDALIPLKEIGNLVNDSNGDLFISIHINSFKDSDIKGITGYYYDENGYESEERKDIAESIVDKICKNSNWTNKGIIRQNLAVLRYSKIPCALIECGYLTNKDDREKLQNDNDLKSLGKSIAEAISETISKD